MNTENSPYRCSRPRRSKLRRFQNVNHLIRSIEQINDEVHDRSMDMVDSVHKLCDAKLHLQRIIDEVRELESDLQESNAEFKRATEHLGQVIDDMRTPQLYTFEKQQQTILDVHISLAEQEIITATKEIKDIEKEIKINSPVFKIPGPKYLSNRCFDKVIIPEVDPKGFASLIASFDENPKCTICLEAKSDCVLYRCGHICSCFTCAIQLTEDPETRKCPICRSFIKEVIKTNLC